mgnify:CR=1 FL=1
MSSDDIEITGIDIFKTNFLFNRKIITPRITANDKGISWDGYIDVFDCENHNNAKARLLGRVPVQVKSSNRRPYRTESYPFNKSDLKNYYNYGGIIFIRPIFISLTDYKIYYSILLPVKIKRLLEDNKDKSKVKVNLKRANNCSEFEDICIFFIQNSKKQFNIDNIKDITQLAGSFDRIKVEGFGPGGLNFFSEDTCFYIEANGVEIPLENKLFSLDFNTNIAVTINDIVFFDNVKINKTANCITIYFNSMLTLIQKKNNDFSLEMKAVDGSAFHEVIACTYFFQELAQKKSFKIGDIEISNLDSNIKQNNWKGILEELNVFKEALIYLGFSIEEVLFHDFFENYSKMQLLVGVFIKKTRRISIKKNVEEAPFSILDQKLFNKNLLFFLAKTNNAEEYDMYSFFENELSIFDFHIKASNGTNLKTSRFLLISTPEQIWSCQNEYPNIESDLIEKYSELAFEEYQRFIFTCIAAFDKYRNENVLQLAESIQNMVMEVSSFEEDSLGYLSNIINKYQIIKRKRHLDNEEKALIFNLKNKYNSMLKFVACANILLDSHTEFEMVFKSFEDSDKQEFRSWPIFALATGDFESA